MKNWKYLCFTVCLILLVTIVKAQPDLPDDPDVPIDGGLSLLVAAGIGYGAKALKKAKEKRNTI